MWKPLRAYATQSLATPTPRPPVTRVDAALATYAARQQAVERTYAAWRACGVLSRFYEERLVAFGEALDERELAYAEVVEWQREAIK